MLSKEREENHSLSLSLSLYLCIHIEKEKIYIVPFKCFRHNLNDLLFVVYPTRVVILLLPVTQCAVIH